MSKQIAIIGAGIGGLTLALYLKKNGYQPCIYESASALAPIGAGIMMAGNAMQIFEDLGMSKSIASVGNLIKNVIIADTNGKPILSTTIRQPFSNVALHRADLQKILADALGHHHIQLGKKLHSITQTQSNIHLQFEDGSEVTCDVAFGADGIHSIVRKHIAPHTKIMDAGQLCWRGICEIQNIEIENQIGVEYWASGVRFGYTRINAKQVYWYAVCNSNLSKNNRIPEQCKNMNPIANFLISNTSTLKIHFGNLADIGPIKKWHTNNICLIGDAAHATTPNLGQGGCQAIEDAYTIGKLLEQGYQFAELFPIFQTIRSKKVNTIVKQSRLLGKISHLENNFLIQLRNTLMRLSPKSLAHQQLNFINNIQYIDNYIKQMQHSI